MIRVKIEEVIKDDTLPLTKIIIIPFLFFNLIPISAQIKKEIHTLFLLIDLRTQNYHVIFFYIFPRVIAVSLFVQLQINIYLEYSTQHNIYYCL